MCVYTALLRNSEPPELYTYNLGVLDHLFTQCHGNERTVTDSPRKYCVVPGTEA